MGNISRLNRRRRWLVEHTLAGALSRGTSAGGAAAAGASRTLTETLSAKTPLPLEGSQTGNWELTHVGCLLNSDRSSGKDLLDVLVSV